MYQFDVRGVFRKALGFANGAARFHTHLRHAPLTALLLVLAVTPVARAADVVLENSYVALTFSDVGDTVYLSELVSKETNIPIDLQTGSGGWTIRLWNGVGNVNTDALYADMTGAGFDTLTLDSFTGTADSLTAVWTGTVTYLATTTTLTITTTWTLAPTDFFAEAHIRVQLPSEQSLPFYVSEIRFPQLNVTRIGASDVLVAPLISGYLYPQPLDNAALGGIPGGFNGVAVPYAVQLLAYYDDATRNCFYFTDDDTEGWWRVLNVTGNASANRLEFRMRHIPPNIYENRDIQFPYAVRVGAFQGDWVDAADKYRQFLRTECPWYQGPVGSPTNPMPERLKNIVAQVQVGTNYDGDSLDTIERDIMRMTRYYGDGIYTRWYGAHWPDRFERFYMDGYLPGRPTFAAAIHESEKEHSHISAPYIQGMNAYDPDTTPGTHLNDAFVYESVAINEDGTRASSLWNVGEAEPVRSNAMCNDSAWWKIEFPSNVVEIADFTGMHGAYLDYFGIPLCFSTEHDHLPGGGSYMMTARMQHVADIKAGFQSLGVFDYGISMESVFGPMSKEVDLMFADPLRNFSGTQYAISIPFFHYVYDNVKMAKITGVGSPSLDPDVAGWVTANDVFTFGQVIGSGSTVSEGGLSFGLRSLMPFNLYEKRLCNFLRDDGFFRWHNGSMERLPDMQITDLGGFAVDPNPLPDADPAGTSATYYEKPLVPGMWRAPDGALAFAVTNPWVGANKRSFTCEALYDPASYNGAPSPYSVTRVDDDGTMTTEATGVVGTYTFMATVGSGEIVYWVVE